MNLNDRLSRLTPEQRARLASRLATSKRSESSPQAVALPNVGSDPERRYEPFPLSDIQQAYLIGRSEGVELGNIGCHCYFEVDVEDWDGERFEQALEKLIRRHEMLRAIVHPDGRQQILPQTPPYRLGILDLHRHDASDLAAQLDAVRAMMSHRVHRTDEWPLFEFRASLLRGGRARLHVGVDLLIADGRSFEIIFSELAQLYRDPNLTLTPLELSFRDYLVAFNTLESSDLFRESRQYWLERVPTLPPSPELPLLAAPAAVTHPEYRRRSARLAATTWRSLKEKAVRLQLTPAGVLLAAYAEVLTLWSKSQSFLLNVTLFNRLPLDPQVNNILGDFTSVNLLAVDNAKGTSFEARARQQQEQLWRDLAHRYFSGIRVMRELTRFQGVGPQVVAPVVFTSLLNLGSGSEDPSWLGRLGENVYAITQTPQVYLDCMVQEDRGELVINWDAVDQMFPPGLLDGLFQAYSALLEQLAAEESSWSRTLAEHSRRLLPPSQTQRIAEVNQTDAPLSDEFLHTLFLKQVRERPQQIAVSTPNRRVSYAELYSRACRIEEELLARGLEPNQLVGIVMDKGWEQVVAVLGVLFAGGAYMPVDPELPPERQRYLIENGDVKVVLTQTSVRARVSVPHEVEVLTVDDMEPLEGTPPVPRTRQKPEDLAYVIYTSGSTGQPKGVMIDHRGAVNTVLDINQRFGIGPEDRVLALSRLNFDLSVYDIFGLLAAGGTIVMPAAELSRDTTHWAQLIVAEKVTVWDTVPALMGLLVEQAEQGEAIGQSLRVIMLSGDWIPVGLPGQIRRLLPRATIMSLGGATEASIWSILYPIEQVDAKWKSIPYGKPMLNQTFHVLNHAQAPCPVWVPGQLYIGGIGLARGYWRDAEKTSASFVHQESSGQRLYRTGDWGRYLPDGNIEFLGREDSQVKVQGYRIELGEIEAKLQEHEAVEHCVVVVREDTPGEKRLVGYVVAQPSTPVNTASLREFLRAKLPEYMVPATFVFLDQFPLTANGKVNRNGLPAVARTQVETNDSNPVGPQDVLELKLTGLWEKILNVHPIHPRDNFFDLGGNSLLAVRLFSELRKQTGRVLALSTLFQAPTVEKLAALLRTEGWSPSWTSLVPIRAGGSKPSFYCVHGAGGNVLLFHDLARLLGPDYPFYGVQAHGMDGTRDYLETVEEMAKHYLKEIRELQPRGPYYLGGFCMGGQVAYEMAQILRQDGEKVALLAMIDTHNFHGVPLRMSFSEQISHAKEKIGFHWGNFVRLSMAEEFVYLKKKVMGACHREFERLHVRIANILHISHQPNGGVAHDLHLERLNEEAHFAYVADPYPGRVTIFKPQRNYAFARDEKMGWGESIADLDLAELPVDPGGIFVEPYVRTLADGLRTRIDEAARLEKPPEPHKSTTVPESVLA